MLTFMFNVYAMSIIPVITLSQRGSCFNAVMSLAVYKSGVNVVHEKHATVLFLATDDSK